MPRSRATPSRPPTSPAGGCSATARTTTSRLLAVGGSGQPLDDDAVGLDGDGDGAMARPVLGVEGVVLDRRIEPEPVAVLAVVEGALERLLATAALAATATTASTTTTCLAGL